MSKFDKFLSDSFREQDGFEKIRTRASQKRDARRTLGHDIHRGGEPALPSTIGIGDTVGYYAHKAHASYNDNREHNLRPGYVYGIYYKKNRVVAVDLMGGKSLKEGCTLYPSYFVADTPEKIKRTGGIVPHYMDTTKIVTVPNQQQYFCHRKSLLGQLDPTLWPDLLVRRTEAIQYSPNNNYQNNCPEITNDPDVVRKGFAFSVIPDCAVRSGIVMPDMISNGLNHQETDILLNTTVDLLARWANSCSQHQRHKGNHFYSFPPMDGPLENYPEAAFRDWRNSPAPSQSRR